MKLACYYAYTSNDYVFDRVVKTMFVSFPVSVSVLNAYIARSANSRFYYIQALYNAQWIKLRERRCRSTRIMTFQLNGIFRSHFLIMDYNSKKKNTKNYKSIYLSHGTMFRVTDESDIRNGCLDGKIIRNNPFRRQPQLHHIQ